MTTQPTFQMTNAELQAKQMADRVREIARMHVDHWRHREGEINDDCPRCYLDMVAESVQSDATVLEAYRKAGHISALEVMPAPPAVLRLAQWLAYRFASPDDLHPDATKAWVIEARKALRAATGLDRLTLADLRKLNHAATTPPVADDFPKEM